MLNVNWVTGGDPTDKGAYSKTQGAFCQLCGAWLGNFGLEPTPELYIQHGVEISREVRRVLRDDGTFFLNLGDSYCGSGIRSANPGGKTPKQMTNRGSYSVGAQCGQLYGNFDKAKSDYLDRDCLSQNPCDAHKDVRYFRTLGTPRDPVHEQVHELYLRTLEYMGQLTVHVPNGDCSRQQLTQQSFVSTLGLLQSEAHVAEQLLSSLESMPDESFPQPQDRYHLLGNLWVFQSKLRSLIDGAQAYAHRLGDFQATTHNIQGKNDDAFLLALRNVYKDMVCVCCNACESWLNPPYIQPQHTINNKFSQPKPKDLVGIPWMAAFALRDDGWWLRQAIPWVKANPMPESVDDRPSTAHEYLFLFSKSRRYYYDKVAIFEPVKEVSVARGNRRTRLIEREGMGAGGKQQKSLEAGEQRDQSWWP